MSGVPNGWEIGARLRRPGYAEGVIVFLGHWYAVLDVDGVDNALAYYVSPRWELVSPFPPIPEDFGTVVQHRSTPTLIAARRLPGWVGAGWKPASGWKPDPAYWQQLIPKEQQP